MVLIKTCIKQKPNGKMGDLIVMLQKLNKAFDEENRKDIKESVARIQSLLRTMNFSNEQTLIIQLIAQLVHCRLTTLKMKRLLRKL